MPLRASLWCRTAALLVIAAWTGADRACAFAPEAGEALTVRLLHIHAVGPAGSAAGAAGRILDAQLDDPELLGARLRCDGAAGARPGGGDALDEFARALDALERAFAIGAPAGAIDSLAWFARVTANLADPFETVPPAASELEGARARFSDDLPASLSAAVGGAPAQALARDDAIAAARDLARESASLRTEAERVALAGNGAALEALQLSRLERAASLAAGALAGARARAGAAAPPHAPVLVVPCPVRDRAAVSFTLPGAGTAEIALFDAGGRRRLAFRSGPLAAGRHAVEIEASRLAALPAGVYFVRVTCGSTGLSGRFVRAAPDP